MLAIRTDRHIHLVHSDDPSCPPDRRSVGWVDVDEVVPGALTVTIRALSQPEFFEVASIAKVRAERVAIAEGLDPFEVLRKDDSGRDVTLVSKLENGHLSSLAARRGIVAVHGVELASPTAIFDRLLPSHAADLSSRIMALTVLAHDPFERGESVR